MANKNTMNKTDLVNRLFERHNSLSYRDAKDCVNLITEKIIEAVAKGNGVEIRGFGSFSLKTRAAYAGKHPKTLEKINISKKYIPFFKAGKSLKQEVKNINLR